MLGFRPWDMYLPVAIDYSKSVEEVYTDFARAMLEHKNLVIFDDAGIWNRRDKRALGPARPIRDSPCLPSWVPEHRAPNLSEVNVIPWKSARMYESWTYCAPVTSWLKNNRYERRLFVQCVRLGNIEVGFGFNQAPDSRDEYEDWIHCCLVALHNSVHLGTDRCDTKDQDPRPVSNDTEAELAKGVDYKAISDRNASGQGVFFCKFPCP
jgi:hypothetical protein